MSDHTDESDARFCPVCDVSTALHDGPDSCSIAGMKAAIITAFYGASVGVPPLGGSDA